jgi:hypothetical protein
MKINEINMVIKDFQSSFQKCVVWNFIQNTLIMEGEKPTGAQAVRIGLTVPIRP